MTKIIHILTVAGSPRGIIPEDIYGRGVGGAEKALIQLSQALVDRGYHITVYNDPREWIDNGSFQFRPFSDFVIEDTNRILITFRGPHEFTRFIPSAKKHIGWSCDQYTVGDYAPWYRSVDNMVLISPYHQLDHTMRAYIDRVDKIKITDLGVLKSEYKDFDVSKKVPYQVIYCSQPDRGLNILSEYWDEIIQRVPQLQLNIFGGFSLWNGWNDLDSQFRVKWLGKKNVIYHGKVDRQTLVNYQHTSEALLYPCIFPELFNISTAECLSAGNYCITSSAGAIDTTNFGAGKITGLPSNVGFKEKFINEIVSFFEKPIEARQAIQTTYHIDGLKRFDWDVIADYWEKEILNV